jgi:hypothetical protein
MRLAGLTVKPFFQIRNNNNPVDQRLYSTIAEAVAAVLKRNDPNCEVVQLDTPAGAVVRRFTFVECEKIPISKRGAV